MKKTPVAMFADAFTKAARTVDLVAILEKIKGGHYRARVQDLRDLRTRDVDAYDKEKRKLPAFCISGTAEGRKKPLAHSGLLQVDLDDLDGTLGAVRERVKADPHIAFGFLSPSGDGLKLGLAIDGARHVESFEAAREYFKATYGLDIDPAVKDRLRLCFVSHDPETWTNESAKPLPIPTRTAPAEAKPDKPRADLPAGAGLDVAKLENTRRLDGGAIQAACPACRATGGDHSGDHLRIEPNGKFGCAKYPGDHEHRSMIFKLAGVGLDPEQEQFLNQLAALPALEYDRARADAAKKLGLSRVATLDAEVDRRRPQSDKALGSAVQLPEVEPWPDAVDAAEVLGAVAQTFAKYIALPPGAADALALWTAHCFCFDAFVHTPRLNLCSPEKGCGKTTALDVLAALTPRPLRTESITPAVLFRLVESYKPVLLLDEVDSYLSEAEELRGLLNAGHKRGATAYRCEGESNRVRGFSAFAPAALAGIGNLPGTLHDRSIVVRLVRAKPGEVRARFDSRHTEAEAELARKLAGLSAANFCGLEKADPDLPPNAYNRLADNWRPLFAIAEVAGGDWPARAADAFAKLTSDADADAQGLGVRLLADIAAAFTTADADRMPSAKLAEALEAVEGAPWAEFGRAGKPISANQLARQLKRFAVEPRTIKLHDGSTAKGYLREYFAEAWERFLPQTSVPNRNPVTTRENIGESDDLKPSPAKTGLRFENSILPNKTGHGYAVTVANRPEPEVEEKELL